MISISIWVLVALCILALPMVLVIAVGTILFIACIFEAIVYVEDENDYRWK